MKRKGNLSRGIEIALKDAQRYRWLKKIDSFTLKQIAWRFREACVIDTDVDRVIDIAMAADAAAQHGQSAKTP